MSDNQRKYTRNYISDSATLLRDYLKLLSTEKDGLTKSEETLIAEISNSIHNELVKFKKEFEL